MMRRVVFRNLLIAVAIIGFGLSGYSLLKMAYDANLVHGIIQGANPNNSIAMSDTLDAVYWFPFVFIGIILGLGGVIGVGAFGDTT